MPMLNFMRQFVEPIRLGTKAHTIRADRKVPIKKGDKLYLYCGARHPGAFRILPEAEPCTCVRPIRIHVVMVEMEVLSSTVHIDGAALARDEMESLARADGFPDWNQMRWFWIKRHGKISRAMGRRRVIVDFSGQIIYWRPRVAA
jgi:hypothetical protein